MSATSRPTPTLSRRAAVRLGGGGIAAALGARGLPSTAAQDGPAATFVLVPGTWAGAWYWRKIIPRLRAAGHDVYATSPTGLGERIHLADPALDLDTYISDIVNLLVFEDLSDVTLVGHSFGGMPITGVAERVPERLAQLVYLDALVPADGEDFYDADLDPPEARAEVAAAGEAAGIPGFIPVQVDFVRALTKDPADLEWLLARLVPQPIATWTQPIRLANPAAAAVPRAFVFCTEGKGSAAEDPFVRNAERAKSAPDWQYRELADNHLAHINAPQATAEVLLSLV
jgi:pimeloyl-ACP methyl ester carboxylesterase